MKKQLAKNKQMKRAKLDKDLSNVNEGLEEDPTFDHKSNFGKSCNMISNQKDDIADSSK